MNAGPLGCEFLLGMRVRVREQRGTGQRRVPLSFMFFLGVPRPVELGLREQEQSVWHRLERGFGQLLQRHGLKA